MKIITQDYNNADQLIEVYYSKEWCELKKILKKMPLHLKASDQAGKQGDAIFDPVGTNAYIKKYLSSLDWIANKEIPLNYRFLGTDIDFVKSAIIVEIQFSNYPFLLNNLLRSEQFFQKKIKFTDLETKLLIIVTKNHMFPSSNSTLYFEQAQNQLNSLSKIGIFKIPIRLVGLASNVTNNVPCIWTTYDDPRYSRTIETQENINVKITNGKQEKSRAIISR